ncbi:MAG: hypothetical protein D6B26_06390, partial [Spirochaetaceae bacterium]
MRKILFPALVVILSGLFLLLPPISGQQEADVYQAKEGQLLLPQSNVAIVVLDLERAGLKFVSSDDHDVIRELQDDLVELPGAARIESILNTSRVIAEEDEIIVSRAVPSDPAAVDDEYLQSLVDQLPDFPELSPYISADTGTLLFYVYYSNRTPTIDIYQGLKTLQDEWADRLEFEFTGRAPILAETERLLTGDILIFLPILAVMVILIFGLFRQIKAMAVSIVLIILAMVFGYGMVRFAGIPDSPLILLIPVFGMGLLSDYLIHYLYHRFHTPSLPGQDSLRKKLIYPLSLTALSTVAGFVSLSLINGSGHLQLGLIVAVAVAVTWIGVFFWVDYQPWRVDDKPMFPGFQKMQGRLFARIARFRYVFFLLVALAVVWGASQLGSLRIEPYPIGQLPAATTIRQADNLINNDFYGTMPFFIEVDTGKKLGMLNKEAMLALDKVHQHFEAAEVGYAFSVLTVLKRMNYYFMGDEESLLTSTEFDDFYDSLIEQYLLYYSS